MSYIKEEPDLARLGKAEILSLRTATVPPYTTTNTVFYGVKNFLVIDPATKDKDHQAFLINHIQARLTKSQSFLGVLLTHHHGDHTGSADLLRETFQVPILAHARLAEQVDFGVDNLITEGDTIKFDDGSFIQALYTPGHADSHLVFFDENEGYLIAGDMITDRGTILIPPNSGSLKIYLENLNRLAALPLKAVIPAHGKAIVDAPRAFLLKAIKHRLERIQEILLVLEKSPGFIDATEITNAVYKRHIEDNLMFFAQLSVESSLYWLKENDLAIFEGYRWHVQNNASIKKKELLLALEEIDQRLRDA